MKRLAKRWTAGWMLSLGLVGCASGTAARSGPLQTPAVVTQTITTAPVVVETVVAPSSDLVDRAWMGFRDQRDSYLELVADRLVECAESKAAGRSPDCERRRGSFEVSYGLTALYRLTHQPAYLEAADAAIDARSLRKVTSAAPYEASFFLALATEREATKRRTDLHATAGEVAVGLEAWLTEADDYEFAQRSMFGNEDNAAVVLGRLWAWAELTADDAMQTRLRSLTERRFVGVEMDSWCPQPVDCEPENFEFLPPCLQRASTVLSVMPQERSNPWLEAFLAKQSELEPVVDPRLGTHEALNFTRATALWALFEATGETRYRAKYVEHVEAGMRHLAAQKSEDQEIDPWHAAFAVHALSVSFEG